MERSKLVKGASPIEKEPRKVRQMIFKAYKELYSLNYVMDIGTSQLKGMNSLKRVRKSLLLQIKKIFLGSVSKSIKIQNDIEPE